MNKSEPVISREIRKNSIKKKGTNKNEYLAIDTEYKAYLRRWWAKSQSMKINMNTELKLYILSELERIDIITSPKSIARSWNDKTHNKKKHITHESIYIWLEQWDQDKYRKYLLYKRDHKKVKTVKWSRIIGRIWLDKRPIEATNRSEQGHFEADLVVSNKWNNAAILTLIDRKTRLPRIFKLQNIFILQTVLI